LGKEPVYLLFLKLSDFYASLDVAHVPELLPDVIQLRLELRVLLQETVDLIMTLFKDVLLRLSLLL
jgi:hypothetical protein